LLKLWRIKGRQFVLHHSIQTDRISYEICCNGDGTAVAFHSDNRKAVRFLAKCESALEISKLMLAHEEAERSEAWPTFRFSPDGKRVAYSSVRDGCVEIWRFPDLGTKPECRLKTKSWALDAIRFSPDGSKLCASGVDGRLYLWALKDGKGELLKTLKEKTEGTLDVAVSDTGDHLALAYKSHWGYRAGAVVRELNTGKSRTIQIGPRGDGTKYKAGAFVGGVSLVAVGDSAGFIEVWDIDRSKKVHSYECRSPCYAVTWAEKTGVLAAGCWDGTIHLIPFPGSQGGGHSGLFLDHRRP
jgi:WD40 repeat protein